MPSVPIYIRKEDWPKWESIQDKPTFIHNALNNNIKSEDGETLFVDKGQTRRVATFKSIRTKGDVIPAIKQVFPDAKFEPLYRDKKNKRL